MRNKNALSHVAISENINDAKELTSQDELVVWDNLIYQTIARSSVFVREALIQLLVANKFSESLTGDVTFTEDQEKQFIRFVI
ncbi:hypothetical protein [uncultured Winogradskyella sp.]|uniref:hypothetical protein n=1 Tax=uncultured Winogradskyella sp. TaxID=395353 RepID=UPI002616A3C2|nr:hypothetical protein [uncultured Winogradskyella sp.]